MINKKGFTLVELLVIITVVGILATIGSTYYSGVTLKSKYLTFLNNFEHMQANVFNAMNHRIDGYKEYLDSNTTGGMDCYGKDEGDSMMGYCTGDSGNKSFYFGTFQNPKISVESILGIDKNLDWVRKKYVTGIVYNHQSIGKIDISFNLSEFFKSNHIDVDGEKRKFIERMTLGMEMSTKGDGCQVLGYDNYHNLIPNRADCSLEDGKILLKVRNNGLLSGTGFIGTEVALSGTHSWFEDCLVAILGVWYWVSTEFVGWVATSTGSIILAILVTMIGISYKKIFRGFKYLHKKVLDYFIKRKREKEKREKEAREIERKNMKGPRKKRKKNRR